MNPFDTAINFENLYGFSPVVKPMADGMRASLACECPSCAIIQYINPKDDRIRDYFPTGVAFFGHITHQAWSWASFGAWSDTHIIEQAVPWIHGVSHEDTVITQGEWAGQYEVKTHSDTEAKSPSAANRRQTEFRMRLREHAGMPIHGPTRIVTISTAGREKGIARGPWEIQLTDERRAEIDDTLERINSIMQRADSLNLWIDTDLEALADGCSTCFPKAEIRASFDQERVMNRAIAAQNELKKAEAMRAIYAAQKKTAKAAYDEAKTLLAEHVPNNKILVANVGKAAITKTGIRVTKSDAT